MAAISTMTVGSTAYNIEVGTKVTGTVSSSSVAFSNSSIKSTSVIDGPYIQDVLIGIDSVETGTNSITYTLEDDSADGKSAYIWVRN